MDSEALAGLVSRVYQAGIPIVLVDSLVDTEDFSVCLKTDNYNAGRAAAAEMLRKLQNAGVSQDEPAEVAVQIGSETSQTIIDRLEGFKAYWDEIAPPQWAVLWDDIKINEGNVAKATEIGHEFLTKYPNVIGLFAPNNGSTAGFALALEESNRTDITLVGFDFSGEIESLIRNEDFNVSTMYPLEYKMGYDATIIALKLANGGAISEKIIDTGVIAIDKENIDDPQVQLWLDGNG
jgi:ribose transport system substrate-binding protein